MHVGIDLDGVLINFSRAFTTLMNELYGTPILDPHECKAWGFSSHMDGLTHEQEKAAWAEIDKRPGFFTRMESLVRPEEIHRLNRLGRKHAISFITNRRGTERCVAETQNWLRNHNFVHHKNVFHVAKKGRSAYFLGINAAIDDDGGNVIDYLDNHILGVLYRRPYNEAYVELVKDRGGRVVNDFTEFLDLLHVFEVRQDELFDNPMGPLWDTREAVEGVPA